MAKKRLPRFREITSFGRVYVWLDERDGASAAVCMNLGELTGEDLRRIFRIAQSNDITVTSRRPLLVHGSVTGIGESERFRFIQMDTTVLAEFEREIRSARGI